VTYRAGDQAVKRGLSVIYCRLYYLAETSVNVPLLDTVYSLNGSHIVAPAARVLIVLWDVRLVSFLDVRCSPSLVSVSSLDGP